MGASFSDRGSRVTHRSEPTSVPLETDPGFTVVKMKCFLGTSHRFMYQATIWKNFFCYFSTSSPNTVGMTVVMVLSGPDRLLREHRSGHWIRISHYSGEAVSAKY